MNNTVENDYSIQVRWATVQAIDVKFAQDLAHQKITKIG